MLLATSVLKSVDMPNKYPQLTSLLLTFTSDTYVFVGDAPDMNYKPTADIIGTSAHNVKIPKIICRNGQIHGYQDTGSTQYMGIVEVLQ